jgi:hypothetical protein
MVSGQERRQRLRGSARLAILAALGLASACLNPEISDEPPISESEAALDAPDAPDAGSSDDEQQPDVTEVPSTAPSPPITRRPVWAPNPTRR